jgi:hypothetical protein
MLPQTGPAGSHRAASLEAVMLAANYATVPPENASRAPTRDTNTQRRVNSRSGFLLFSGLNPLRQKFFRLLKLLFFSGG